MENLSMLQTEPSFCIYTNEEGIAENEKGDLEIKSSEGTYDCKFSFADTSVESIVEDDKDRGFKNVENEKKNAKCNEQIEPQSPKMYLATGFGIDVMGDVEYKPTTFDEEYYKMMVINDPCNPLFLRNYARLLQTKGDLTGAEDYYLRATMQDPKDGEILLQYGKLVWQVHHDQDRALSYFEKAAHAAPGDCNIAAAYASFLWETEVEDEDYDHGDSFSLNFNGWCSGKRFSPSSNPASTDFPPLTPLKASCPVESVMGIAV